MTNGGREPGWTLRRRLQVIITLALLPVVLVSIFQGVARARLDIANVHDRLLQSARTVAAGDQNLLAAAEQVLRAGDPLEDGDQHHWKQCKCDNRLQPPPQGPTGLAPSIRHRIIWRAFFRRRGPNGPG